MGSAVSLQSIARAVGTQHCCVRPLDHSDEESDAPNPSEPNSIKPQRQTTPQNSFVELPASPQFPQPCCEKSAETALLRTLGLP